MANDTDPPLPAVVVRAATPDDADTVAKMWAQFAAYLRSLGDTDEQAFDASAFLRDGFGPDPAFAGLIAEVGDRPVGYLIYHFGYDVDRAVRLLFIADLWIDPAVRRHGAATALMRAAAERARARNASELIWSVFAPNRDAIAFYERLGAHFLEQLRFMHLPVEALAGPAGEP